MITPLGKRVVIKRDVSLKEIELAEGAMTLIVPETAQKPELSGTVIAIGKEVTEVKLGDRVLFGKFDGQDIAEKYTGEPSCIIINEEQIKAIYV